MRCRFRVSASGLIFDGILNRTPVSAAATESRRASGTRADRRQVPGEGSRPSLPARVGDSRGPAAAEARSRVGAPAVVAAPAGTRAGLRSGHRSILRLSAAVIVIASAVAAWSVPSASANADRQRHYRSGRLHQQDGRPGVRSDASTRTRGTTRAIAISQHRPRRPHPPSAAADGPAANGAVDRRCGARHLRAHWQHRGCRGIDCEPRHAVHPRPARAELRDRRSARPGTTPGSAERRRAERPQPARDAIQDTRRRIAGNRPAALDTARGVQHRLDRRAEGVQCCVSRDRHANGDPAAQTRRRDRSRFRDCAFTAGPVCTAAAAKPSSAKRAPAKPTSCAITRPTATASSS